MEAALQDAVAAHNYQLAGTVQADLEAVKKQIAALASSSSSSGGVSGPGAAGSYNVLRATQTHLKNCEKKKAQ